MLSKLKKPSLERSSRGFTIIEVMIVLAIAGLILLIVFLAVPALQRNARNTQRKNDAANISSTFATFESNNSGTLPSGLGGATAGQLDLCLAGGKSGGAVAATACDAGNTETSKIGFYVTANIYETTATTAAFAAPTVTAVGSESLTKASTQSLIFELAQSCGVNNAGAYSARSVAVWYVTESANGNGSLQCVD